MREIHINRVYLCDTVRSMYAQFIHKNMARWKVHRWSGSFATDSPSQLDILGHDRHSLGMNGTQISVLKKSNQIGLRCFLKGTKTQQNIKDEGNHTCTQRTSTHDEYKTSTTATYLKGANSSTLEAQVSLEILSDFTDKSLEGKLSDQKLCRLLVSPNLTKGHSTRLVTVRLLDSSSWRSALPGGFSSELLPWGLASSGLTGGLLGSGHAYSRSKTWTNPNLAKNVKTFLAVHPCKFVCAFPRWNFMTFCNSNFWLVNSLKSDWSTLRVKVKCDPQNLPSFFLPYIILSKSPL